MKKIYWLVSLLIPIITLSGCLTGDEEGGGFLSDSKRERAINVCVNNCQRVFRIEDLSQGPCLSNVVVDDWVCDIAHRPRTSVDDDPANQCSAYNQGIANHFVELDLDCNIIRAE